MNMNPVLVSQLVDLSAHVVVWEINLLFYLELQSVVINNQMDVLVVVHNVESLFDETFLVWIVLDVLRVCFKCNYPATWKLIDLCLWYCFFWVIAQCQFENLVNGLACLGIVNLLLEATLQMPVDHFFAIAHCCPACWVVQWSNGNAIVELHHQRHFLILSNLFR